jgi:hypothetical protein
MKNLIIDKGELSKPDISYFLSVLKQAVEVTDKKLELTKNRFFELNDKKKSENLSIYEEEEYLHLYRQLRTIGEVDDIPVQLLNSDIDGKLDNLLYQLDQLIGE